MRTQSEAGHRPAQEIAGAGAPLAGAPSTVESLGGQRETMLGEWIGASLERFLRVTGERTDAGGAGGRGLTVLAAEVPLRPRAQRPADVEATWPRGRDRAPGVAIVKWHVYGDESAKILGEMPGIPRQRRVVTRRQPPVAPSDIGARIVR